MQYRGYKLIISESCVRVVSPSGEWLRQSFPTEDEAIEAIDSIIDHKENINE